MNIYMYVCIKRMYVCIYVRPHKFGFKVLLGFEPMTLIRCVCLVVCQFPAYHDNHIFMHVYMCVCMYVCMYVCVCVFVCDCV